MAKKILFVCPYPIKKAPSQRFRFEQYFAVLEGSSFLVSLHPFFDAGTWEIMYQPRHLWQKISGTLKGFLKRFALLFSVHHFDFVFIHREASPLGPPFFEWAVAHIWRKKIIYDFDDAIWLPNTSSNNMMISWLKGHGKVKATCKWSYKVSCGNRYLTRFAGDYNSAVVLNPTTIDTDLMHNPQRLPPSVGNSPNIVIGWTGTHSTLCYIEPLVPIIDRLSRRYKNIHFLVIADKKPTWDLDCLKFIRWNRETEIADLMKIDVGIMPLNDDAWCRGKCGFKALQYMSLEKPTLVSPIGVAKEIVDHGVNGFHCTTLEDWEHYLQKLITDNDLEMGKKGREKVIQHYSVAANTLNFLSLFD